MVRSRRAYSDNVFYAIIIDEFMKIDHGGWHAHATALYRYSFSFIGAGVAKHAPNLIVTKRIFQKSFCKDRPILIDKEALQKDLSNNTVIAFGTPKGNLFIAEHIAGMPIQIESDRIIAEKVYEGTHLRFISAWPNPRNPEKGMVFYTAQCPEDVPYINSVFHGPTDYVIARAREVLTSENYTKQNGTWSLTTVLDTGIKTERKR